MGSILPVVRSRKIFDCIACYAPWVAKQGSLAPRLSSNFQKRWLFPENVSTQNWGHFFSYAVSPETTKKTMMKKFLLASKYFCDYTTMLDVCFPKSIQ